MSESLERFQASVRPVVVSNDAGGAQNLAHFVANNPKNYSFLLGGPALEIYSNVLMLKSHQVCADITTDFDFLLASTGWSSNLEVSAIKSAKQLGIFCVAILDHWANYDSRLMINGEKVFPDAIWVVDTYAYDLASSIFTNVEISQVPNYYLESEIIGIESIVSITDNQKSQRVLFLGENISAHANLRYSDELYFGYNESTGFQYFLENFKFSEAVPVVLRIRLHPSESNPDKYLRLLLSHKKYFSEIEISNFSLNQDIAWATEVCGLSSFALYVADCAGKSVFSCIPSESYELPFPKGTIKKIENRNLT